ncbi:hypothetical protein Egran_00802 [Elaphomyces granulatus]|uniref:Rho-GAP domain-containing protein n=1 Tax=Elaphomyces granulatus TaxID=519963 RepID=A0A232M593_9EURO|nr:hypothetical protein Egran_00802 [Elaphomyces granulatus]
MPLRHSTVLNLDLVSSNFEKSKKNEDSLNSALSSLSPRSAKSSPGSPFAKGSTIRPVTRRSTTEGALLSPITPNAATDAGNREPPTPGFTAIPQYPSSPKNSTKHNRDPSRSFFANLKASKSAHKITSSDGSRHSEENRPKSRGSSRDRLSPSKSNSSTPDLLGPSGRPGQNTSEVASAELKSHLHNGCPEPETIHVVTLKRSKPRFTNLLTRTRSIRVDDGSAGRTLANRRPSNAGLLRVEDTSKHKIPEAMKTAPLREDRAFKDAAGSTFRNRSADRPSENGQAISRKERAYGSSIVSSSSLSQVSGASALFNNLKQSSTGAADRIEQTRRTRISKRLQDCKDKTEYWMPALPYRCIDYLNFKGCEEEGLYRVPGKLDINLFDVPDLYDINTIGSMFKAWLRELPDELFPKETQAMIAEKCEGATTAPQLLRDELSKLPPYNYYLLFAITCHLNLLHSYVDQNKMDYRNLCICFQPCMKIDGFCFQFLVCDWKNCWQGCFTEREFLKAETEAVEKVEREIQPRLNDLPPSPHDFTYDERAISSSGSSQAAAQSEGASSNSGSPKSRRQPPQKFEGTHSRSFSQLPELGPPLSPIRI